MTPKRLYRMSASRISALEDASVTPKCDVLTCFGVRRYYVVFTLPRSFQGSALLCFASLVQILLGEGKRCPGIRRQGKFFMCLSGENRRSAMPRRSVILCVDDELNGLEGRKMLLEEGGCKVLVATSGAEALQL